MSSSSATPVSIIKLFSASCRPPPLRCGPDAATADWVLLEPLAYVADRTNATTAEAISSTGYTIQATFCAADPPDVSCVCIHCPGIEEADFPERPRIICSHKDLLLLWVTFKFGPYDEDGLREHFVYKAGPGRPSLHLLPDPLPFVARAWEVGLVPHGDDGHFLLAALCFTQTPWVYDLSSRLRHGLGAPRWLQQTCQTR
ncbi:uncharacterized protein [Aegilops tauschii subsp. strangulata]|uniref:uncharacterized protein n=1 Tax=Aegilops tauschii subsp. strangulata TaxID=200361 RepID=UPI00098B1904|nr:uncharacterized protein LOC109753451 isoform X2 [Aegilops tauschii subsp. strangulata]XP_044376634.1 uncharacterized protein LOC123098650 isoform X2 [Triticum aestivum]